MTTVWLRNRYGLSINPKFQSRLRPLNEHEKARLTTSLKEHGVRDPIVVWKKTLEILDGHNRYVFAEANGLDYSITEVDLSSEEDCLKWIADNQRARRNLTPVELEQEAHRVVEALGGSENATRRTGSVYERAAQIIGEAPRTIRQRASRARYSDKLIEPIRKLYENGKVKISLKLLGKLCQLSAPEQMALFESVEDKSFPDIRSAVAARFPEETHESTFDPEVSEEDSEQQEEWEEAKEVGDEPEITPVVSRPRPQPPVSHSPSSNLSSGVFEKAEAALGSLVRAIDDIGLRVPNYDQMYDKCRSRLSDIKDLLDRWKDLHDGGEF